MTKATANKKKVATTSNVATLAPVIEALHAVYAEKAAEVLAVHGVVLPPVVFTVQRSAKAWGHVTLAPTWNAADGGRHEVMVSGENLGRGAVPVLGTLFHEMAHVFNLKTEVRDVDQNGRHNKRFKKTAEEVFGLSISENRHGWSETAVPESTVTANAAHVARIEAALQVSAGAHAAAGPKPKARNKNLLACECAECGVKVRMAQGVFYSMAPRCVDPDCGGDLVAVGGQRVGSSARGERSALAA